MFFTFGALLLMAPAPVAMPFLPPLLCRGRADSYFIDAGVAELNAFEHEAA
ncbi:hypothetical protein [Pseudoxanthomonas yeongjuensis]|uniref:hypothetical protein n=1 Tax=Pseudoxanthomonas yeongjuensis TaxID=377616 RepID=UPI0013908D4E|nr:hypothetical protein [Pseudoxanthomonas yeongjuensis]